MSPVWFRIGAGSLYGESLIAGKGSRHRTFIDCFAGATRNHERKTDRVLKSSIQMALTARSDNGRRFTAPAAEWRSQ